MIEIDAFKKELFEKLLYARKDNRHRLFSIPSNSFSGVIEDLSVYFDSELKTLVTIEPYRFKYIQCLSDCQNAFFLDITPNYKVVAGVKYRIDYFYDEQNDCVSTIETKV